MRILICPGHLLFLHEPHAHHLIHGGFDESGLDRITVTVTIPIVHDECLILVEVDERLFQFRGQFPFRFRRLGSEGVRNSLFYAFRELGRVVRTRYLLEYIQDIELRETVQASTCKSEEFNNFLQWIFFYNNGIIQENLRHEQSKIVKYNHLVANLNILYNVNAMTRAIKRVRREGVDVKPEHLAELSPYRTSHINLLGQYPLQVNRRAKAQVFKL